MSTDDNAYYTVEQNHSASDTMQGGDNAGDYDVIIVDAAIIGVVNAADAVTEAECNDEEFGKSK